LREAEMIYAMKHGELPPRALEAIDEHSSVEDAKQAVLLAFKAKGDCKLSMNGSQLDDDSKDLAHYGVERDALIHAEVVT
jgi:hypothetical protein